MDDKRFSGLIGQEYDFFRRAIPHYDKMQQIVAKTIASAGCEKILEIGTGVGDTTLALLETNKRAYITSIDNEPQMLQQAQRLLASYIENGRLTLVKADALSYIRCTPSDSIDGVASAFTIHNFSRGYREVLFDEIFHSLKSGGVFVNGDKYAQDGIDYAISFDAEMSLLRQMASKINRQELFEEWHKHYLEDEHPDVIMREKNSLDLLKRIGFSVKIVYRELMEAVICAQKAS